MFCNFNQHIGGALDPSPILPSFCLLMSCLALFACNTPRQTYLLSSTVHPHRQLLAAWEMQSQCNLPFFGNNCLSLLRLHTAAAAILGSPESLAFRLSEGELCALWHSLSLQSRCPAIFAHVVTRGAPPVRLEISRPVVIPAPMHVCVCLPFVK